VIFVRKVQNNGIGGCKKGFWGEGWNMDYVELKQLSELRLSIIADKELREERPDEQLKQLQEVSEHIDGFYGKHQSALPAKLRHFLENRSLQKALDYLESGEVKCG